MEFLDIDLVVDGRPDEAREYQVQHFVQEFLGIPQIPTERDRFLDRLAEEYHERTEAFDRRVCSGEKDGVAMPTNGRESGQINRHALQVRKELLERGMGYGITSKELHRAIQRHGQHGKTEIHSRGHSDAG